MIRKILKGIRAGAGYILSQEFSLRLSAATSSKSGVTNEVRLSSPVVISLTAIPARLNTLHIVVESLLNQTMKPDRLVVWLSEYDREGRKVLDKNNLPSELLGQCKRGLQIEFCEDLRSYRKLLPVMKLYPDCAIVTADDDTIYPKSWLEVLYEKHLEWPDCVVCYRGVKIGFDGEGEFRLYKDWQEYDKVEPSYFLFPQGGEGTIYPVGTFSEEAFDEKIYLNICLTADDVWFKAMSLFNGKKCIKLEEKHQDFLRLRGSQDDEQTLHFVNNTLGQNDLQINAVFKKYRLNEKLMQYKQG
jgi:hypothetical protein